jgi:hypothetical protein
MKPNSIAPVGRFRQVGQNQNSNAIVSDSHYIARLSGVRRSPPNELHGPYVNESDKWARVPRPTVPPRPRGAVELVTAVVLVASLTGVRREIR